MSALIRYRWKLRRLFKEMEKIKKHYSKARRYCIKDKKTREEIDKLWHDERFEINDIKDEINILVTDHPCNAAHRLLLGIPEIKDETQWAELDLRGRKVLSPKGISALRTAIRQERRERDVRN